MKVTLLGVNEPRTSSSLMAESLERLGHRVTHVSYRSDRWMDEVLERQDLIILCKGSPGFSMQDYRIAHSMSNKRVLFWMDTLGNWRSENDFCLKSLKWSYTCTSSQVLSRLEKRTGNTRNRRLVQGAMFSESWGCDEDSPTQPTENRILFFGSFTPRRARILRELKLLRVPIHELKPHKFGKDLQQEILRHMAVLGPNNTTDVISARCQTVLAMGGVMLQEWLPDFQDYADMPKERDCPQLISWRSPKECAKKAKQLISKQRIPDRGPQSVSSRWVRQEFNWDKIMEELVEFGVQS